MTVGGYRFFYGMPLVRATAAQPNRETNDEHRRGQQIFSTSIQNLIPLDPLTIKRMDDRQALQMVWKVIAQLSINNIAAITVSIREISLGGILAALISVKERARKILALLTRLFRFTEEDEEEEEGEEYDHKWRLFPRSRRRVLPKRRCSN